MDSRVRAMVTAAAIGLFMAMPSAFARPIAAHAGSISNLATLINQDRAQNGGLPALIWSDCLASVAQQNAARIAAQGSLSHTDGPDVDFGCAAGGGSMQAGENIAYISSGPDDNQVNTMYMNSPGHRANILGSYVYVGTAWVTASNGYGYNAEEFLSASALTPWPPVEQKSFYFAEGYTGSGFSESLSLLMPNLSGTATIDYYTAAGRMGTIPVALTAGQVAVQDVLPDVGANQQVSARVSLPGPGVVERIMHFNTGGWYGSTGNVGVTAPATEWDFAEGSTLSVFDEYLTLQNPNSAPVAVTLNYFTSGGSHPSKTLTLPATSRTTIAVFNGSLAGVSGCDPATTCGVGRGLEGVSTQVLAASPIIVERPFYVNDFSFGSGPIRDGHDAFGANGASTTWSFAEGTTLAGFYEYLTLQNANTSAAHVTLRYMNEGGQVTTRALTVGAQSRFTVPVFDATDGVGPGVSGVSVQVTSDQPIVAERPMYMVHDFGTGPVAGAHVVVGATGLRQQFQFAAASTLAGDSDFLTVQNPNGSPAHVTATYYTSRGPVARTITVNASSRHTIAMFQSAEGPGPGYSPLGVVVTSDQPIMVEKPTYSANASTYGATDTLGG